MRVEERVLIGRPIESVWAFLTDTFNAPRLRGSGILGLRLTAPGPPGVGSTLQDRRVILGLETRMDHEVIEWDPPHRLATSITGRPFRSWVQRLTLEAAPDSTELVYTSDIEWRPLARALLPFVGPLVRRRAHAAIQDMKRLVEAEQPAADASRARLSSVVTDRLPVRRTFLFTDIVSSTALIEVIGDAAWRDLRRWHDTTLRRLFERHQGQEMGYGGDGFFVAFNTAAAAVACAVEVQRTLAEHRRSDGFAPSIRIGLHSGDVELDGDVYAGSAIHVASRIAARATGGEILASGATVREAGVATADGLTAVRLRGVADPVSVGRIPW
jgi:class 3 adenylate cyclase